MTVNDTLIICGDCRVVHTPAEPPYWRQDGRHVVGSCQQCDAELIRVPSQSEETDA